MWNYYTDETNNDANENNDDDYRVNNEKTIASKSFMSKTKIIGRTSINNNTLNREIAIPLKHLSYFWRSLDLPLINFEIELDLLRLKDCIIAELFNT